MLPIDGDDKDTALASLKHQYDAWRADDVPPSFSVIIRGGTLAKVLDDDKATMRFTALCLAASTVVCCRVTPKQKARIVALAKREKRMSLAIGCASAESKELE